MTGKIWFRVTRILATAMLAAAIALIRPVCAADEVLANLHRQVNQLQQAYRFKEAAEAGEQLVALAKDTRQTNPKFLDAGTKKTSRFKRLLSITKHVQLGTKLIGFGSPALLSGSVCHLT